MHPAKENAAGGFAAKEPVGANVAGTTIKAVKLAGPSRAADEDASNSVQGTGRAQALRKQLAKCRADAAEALKDLAATRERVKKLETARRRAEQRAADAAQQRAADAVQQAPWLHLAHSAHLKYSGDRSAAGY
jgi:flagellar motility protein MotE (MotC chaperone)